MAVPPLQRAEGVDHLGEPLQLTGVALAQGVRLFPALAGIEEAPVTVGGDVQPAVSIEVESEFPGGLRQLHEPLHPAGVQDAQGLLFVVAAEIELLVEVLVLRLDGAGVEQLIQLAPGQMVSHVGNSRPSSHSIHWPA